MILIATGSELHLAMAAREELARRDIHVHVVSMPSWMLFERQPHDYRDSVLPPQVTKRIAIEAGSPLGWHRYVEGAVVMSSQWNSSELRPRARLSFVNMDSPLRMSAGGHSLC